MNNNLSTELAKHFREVYFGGNWTGVNVKDVLDGVDWTTATTKAADLNTIAALVYHINYYVVAVSGVLEGKPLNASDKFSFDLQALTSENDWQMLLEKNWSDAHHFARLVEHLPGEILLKDFADGKYGSYYRNIQGVIEHTHYHLGQIALIKKMVARL